LLLLPLEHQDFRIKNQGDNEKLVKRLKSIVYQKEKQYLLDYEQQVSSNECRSQLSRLTGAHTSPVCMRSDLMLKKKNQHKQEKNQHSIDKFLREKSMNVIRTSWNLNKEMFTSNYTFKTNNLIRRIKDLYNAAKKLKIVSDQDQQELEYEQNTSINTFPIMDIRNLNQTDNNSKDYLQKLSNHYYERKLW
jgi:hypothetical protein